MQTLAPKPINRLGKERSPYLRNAAHQPIHWFPWSAEAFDEAERLDRPILLDIGAVWCHWCHVMDHESYESEEIARVVHDHFVAIKVDRDERPEIDARYQLTVNSLTGVSGWPLTAFLTPQGEVFYGGAYFPLEDRYGKPGFKRILKQIAELYRTRKQDILEDAEKISGLFESDQAHVSVPGKLDGAPLESCLAHLKQQFDFAYGGFGNAPKFFHPSALEFALHQYSRSGQAWIQAVIEKTLDAMGKGGIYDQLGGGFHRYSVDERWVVPHFEKLSPDNASLLLVYSRAFQQLGKPFYREIAQGILRWVRENLSDREQGGFYASQDADTQKHDDGDYYTWTRREVSGLLSPEETAAVLPHFDVEAQGEMPHDPSRNVLFVAKEPEVLARELELRPSEVSRRIESAKHKLLEARKKRRTPFVDRSLYSGWNGLWVRSALAASSVFQDPELKKFALKTLDRFRAGAWDPVTGMTRFLPEGGPAPAGLLEDQVEMLAAAWEAFRATKDKSYLDFAEALAGILRDRFWGTEGGFFDTPDFKEEGHLRIRHRGIQDSSSYSPNATAARIFLKLFHSTQNGKYREQAETLLRFFYEQAKGVGYFAAAYCLTLDFYLRGPEAPDPKE